MKKNEQKLDMTKGNPGKLILTLAIPMILGNVVQQLYSMIDSIVVGRFVGKGALASIGATMSVMQIVIFLIIGLTMGTSIITAQHHGAGEEDMVKNIAGTAIHISVGMSIIIAIVGSLVGGPVLDLLKTPEEIIPGAKTYLLINFFTCIAPIGYYMTASIMRSLGDSKGQLYSLITSSILNIVLDLIFVIVFRWEIAGVAWATAISQVVSVLINLYRIRKHHEILRLSKSNLKLKLDIVKRVISIGIPMSIQTGIASLGMMGIQIMINPYGTDTIAAYSAALKIDQIALMLLSTIGMAVSTYVGQNYGKGDINRIKRGVKAGVIQVVCMGVFLTIAIVPFGGLMTRMFVSAEEVEVISIAKEYLLIVSLFYWLCGIMQIFLNVFRGMGQMKISTIASSLDPIMKLLAAYLLSKVFGRTGLWIGWPIGWAVSLIIPVVMYLRGNWYPQNILKNN